MKKTTTLALVLAALGASAVTNAASVSLKYSEDPAEIFQYPFTTMSVSSTGAIEIDMDGEIPGDIPKGFRCGLNTIASGNECVVDPAFVGSSSSASSSSSVSSSSSSSVSSSSSSVSSSSSSSGSACAANVVYENMFTWGGSTTKIPFKISRDKIHSYKMVAGTNPNFGAQINYISGSNTTRLWISTCAGGPMIDTRCEQQGSAELSMIIYQGNGNRKCNMPAGGTYYLNAQSLTCTSSTGCDATIEYRQSTLPYNL